LKRYDQESDSQEENKYSECIHAVPLLFHALVPVEFRH